MSAVIGVDSSTQSCKVEVRSTDDGRLLGQGSAPHSPTTPPTSEQDPTEWWSAFVSAAEQALRDLDPSMVSAISVDAQCHGLVLLDAEDQPLCKAKLWNDTTSSQQAAELVNQIGAEVFAEAVGTVPTSAFTISKLAWTAQHRPEALAAVSKIMVPHDYLTYRLGGRAVTDRSDASGTGYYSTREDRWLPEYLTAIADRDWLPMLPEVLGPTTVAATIQPEVAQSLGLNAEVKIGPGAGDQHATSLGLGLRPGDVAIALGTSGVVFAPTSTPVADPTGWVSGTADAAGGYLPLICTLNAAKVTDSAAAWLGVSVQDLTALALQCPPTDSGLTYVAFLDGERTPNRPDARGFIHGLGTTTTREQLARAAFEGVVLGLLAGWQRMQELGVRLTGRLMITGGGARSAAYRQVVADLFDAEVWQPEPGEYAARGAALQAAALTRGTSIADQVQVWTPAAKVVAAPSPERRHYLPELIDRYHRLAQMESLDG